MPLDALPGAEGLSAEERRRALRRLVALLREDHVARARPRPGGRRGGGERRQAYSHAALWLAIDVLALRRGVGARELFERAGLSPAGALAKARHDAKTGRPRWPSALTLARLLRVGRVSLAEFGELVAALEIEAPRTPFA